MEYAFTALTAVAGYVLGSVPTALIAARLAGRPDPRTLGTGNAGSSNVALTVGIGPGIAVFLVDLAKGTAAAFAGTAAGGVIGGDLTALAAAAGQVFPVFASFRGGKGVATTLGGYFGLDPALALLGIASWAVGLLLIKRFIVATVAAIAALALSAAITDRHVLFAAGALILTLITHRHDLAAWKRGQMPTIRDTLRDNRSAR